MISGPLVGPRSSTAAMYSGHHRLGARRRLAAGLRAAAGHIAELEARHAKAGLGQRLGGGVHRSRIHRRAGAMREKDGDAGIFRPVEQELVAISRRSCAFALDIADAGTRPPRPFGRRRRVRDNAATSGAPPPSSPASNSRLRDCRSRRHSQGRVRWPSCRCRRAASTLPCVAQQPAIVEPGLDEFAVALDAPWHRHCARRPRIAGGAQAIALVERRRPRHSGRARRNAPYSAAASAHRPAASAFSARAK